MLERELLTIHLYNRQIAKPRGFQERHTGIHAHELAPSGDFFAERAVAAAEIKNQLTGSRIENLQ